VYQYMNVYALPSSTDHDDGPFCCVGERESQVICDTLCAQKNGMVSDDSTRMPVHACVSIAV
jgi:hypothetical protein